jgi:hypothetical protein
VADGTQDGPFGLALSNDVGDADAHGVWPLRSTGAAASTGRATIATCGM